MSQPEELELCLKNKHTMDEVSGPSDEYVVGWGCDGCGKDANDMKSLDIPRRHCAECKVDLCADCYSKNQ